MRITKAGKGLLVFFTDSVPLKIAFSILIVVLLIPAIYHCYGAFRADRFVRYQPELAKYTRALESDPSNAQLWWNRGRFYHYSLSNIEIAQAASDYKKALSLNPYLGQAWMDLSDCYDRMGEYEEAEAAIENAFLVRRFSPLIRWRAGNFYLRRSNLPKMYECFKQACQYDILKLGIAMDVAWKIDPNHREIIDKLIPDNFESDMGYLNFLVAKNELDLAQPVWKRCLKNPIREDFEFKPSSVFSYIDRLLFFNRIGEALQVWDDTLRKARTGLADFRLKDHPPGSSNTISGNLIWNGSFEHEILRGGFDWRYPDNPEVRFRVDAVNRMDQLKSLQVTFGNANISTGHLYQIVPIMKSGTYQLDFYLQTDSLTTDQLPYLIIAGFPDASGASARSDFFPATTSWRKMSVLFTVKRGCDAIQLSLQRNRSGKFDNQITGTLWLDGFVLSRRIDSDKDENALASANN